MKKSDRCKYGCRFLPIVPDLALCPHEAVGRLAHMKGAEADARALLERQGGYAAKIQALEDAEAARRKPAKKPQRAAA